jgi:hypothetical protein
MRIVMVMCGLLFYTLVCSQEVNSLPVFLNHPFYVGATVGYGSTTWQGLVPTEKNKNEVLSISTPISVTEGGTVWGFFLGYELNPYFALEATYSRYPDATVSFDEFSLFAFDYDGQRDLFTRTETLSAMAKVMLIVPRTVVRVYSSAGVAEVHRWDNMTQSRRLSPSFGVGLNYPLSEHVMGELGANYTAGYGESEINPAKDYVPFLYSGFLRLAYRI